MWNQQFRAFGLKSQGFSFEISYLNKKTLNY